MTHEWIEHTEQKDRGWRNALITVTIHCMSLGSKHKPYALPSTLALGDKSQG